MARADRLQRQRKIDGYAVAAIAPVIALIPAWLIAVAAFWWAFVQFYYVPFALFATVWLFLGGLLFVRPIQRLALQRLLGARTPTRAERDTLQRSWHIVAQARIAVDAFRHFDAHRGKFPLRISLVRLNALGPCASHLAKCR